MNSFTYHIPTEIVFGKDSESQCASLICKYGGSRVLLVYGGGSAARSGLLDRLTGQMEAAGLACETLGGVHPNPYLDFAREGVKKALDFGADFILAAGGGSVIDTCKAIAVGAARPDTRGNGDEDLAGGRGFDDLGFRKRDERFGRADQFGEGGEEGTEYALFPPGIFRAESGADLHASVIPGGLRRGGYHDAHDGPVF